MTSRNIKIAYIVPSLDDTTGWGRWACEFLAHVIKRGVEPVLWAPKSAEKHYEKLDFIKCRPYFVLPELFDYIQSRSGMVSLTKIYDYYRTIHKNTNIRLVHSLDAHPWGIYGLIMANKLGRPLVITTHGRYGYIAYNKYIDRIVYKRVIKSASRILTVSDAVKKEILRYYSSTIPQSKVWTILNAVDSDKYTDNYNNHLRTVSPVIISVTRFIPVKDVETSLRAFKIVRKEYPDAIYLIVGPGNRVNNFYYNKIVELINKEQIEGVQMLGRIEKDELESLYMKADVMLHTPRTLSDDFEACPLIILEAGLYSIPVVATRCGGIPEIISHGESGLLVDEQDFRSAAESILEILANKKKAKQLGEKGRQIALSRNWEWYMDQQMKIYDNYT